MSVLECDVKNCHYNQKHKCAREHILVAGAGARISESTSCRDFIKRTEDNQDYEMAVEMFPNNCAIRCEATKCMYNDVNTCCAGEVHMKNIKGKRAHCVEDTCCDTFREK